MPSLSSHQGTVHLKISFIDNKKKEVEAYKGEVPDTKKTNLEANGSSGGGINGGRIGSFNVSSRGGGVAGLGMSCDDGIVINLDSSRSVAGDIKVEYYAKQHVIGKKKLFSFWFNTYFVCEKGNDGTYNIVLKFVALFASFTSLCVEEVL